MESPGNVSVYPYSGTLLAFGEQALPWQLEPETLETIGQFNFRGSLTDSVLSRRIPNSTQKPEKCLTSVYLSNKAPKLCIYWFDKDGHLKRRTSATMEHPCAVHDFSLTSNYLVFYISPYLLDIDHVVREGYSVMESLNWQPELGSHLLIVSRHTGEQVASITMNGRYCLHLINSSDLGNKLMVDVIELDRPVYDQYQPLPDLFNEMPAGGPVRLSIDLTKRGLISRNELDYQLSPDFPAIDPDIQRGLILTSGCSVCPRQGDTAASFSISSCIYDGMSQSVWISSKLRRDTIWGVTRSSLAMQIGRRDCHLSRIRRRSHVQCLPFI